jgi:hypothetical protein
VTRSPVHSNIYAMLCYAMRNFRRTHAPSRFESWRGVRARLLERKPPPDSPARSEAVGKPGGETAQRSRGQGARAVQREREGPGRILPTGDHTPSWPLQQLRESGKHAKRHSSPTHTDHTVSVNSEQRAGPKWNVTQIHDEEGYCY